MSNGMTHCLPRRYTASSAVLCRDVEVEVLPVSGGFLAYEAYDREARAEGETLEQAIELLMEKLEQHKGC